jgi:hypothetical protein
MIAICSIYSLPALEFPPLKMGLKSIFNRITLNGSRIKEEKQEDEFGKMGSIGANHQRETHEYGGDCDQA